MRVLLKSAQNSIFLSFYLFIHLFVIDFSNGFLQMDAQVMAV